SRWSSIATPNAPRTTPTSRPSTRRCRPASSTGWTRWPVGARCRSSAERAARDSEMLLDVAERQGPRVELHRIRLDHGAELGHEQRHPLWLRLEPGALRGRLRVGSTCKAAGDPLGRGPASHARQERASALPVPTRHEELGYPRLLVPVPGVS